MEELDDAASRLATFLDRECPGGGSGRRHAAEHPGRAYYRIWRLGAIVVPINPLMQDREVQFYLSNTGASALFGSPGYETAVTKGAGDDPNYLEEPTEFGSNPMTPPRAPSDLPAPSVVSCLLWVSWCGRRQARGWCVHRDIAHAWSRAHARPRSTRTSAVLVRRWSHHVDVYVAPPGWNSHIDAISATCAARRLWCRP